MTLDKKMETGRSLPTKEPYQTQELKASAADAACLPSNDPSVSCEDPSIRLYTGDCLAGMEAVLADESVSVVVTSPPYNRNVAYQSYDDNRPRADYLEWMERVSGEITRVLEPDGSLFLNLGSSPTDPWWAWDIAGQFRSSLTLQNVIVWVKSIAIDKDDLGQAHDLANGLAVGHFKPIQSRRFLHSCYEFIFHFTKTGRVPLDRLAIGVPYQDKSNVRRWKGVGQDLRCRGSTWFIPYKTIRNRSSQRPHPATFPEQLPERCLKLHGVSRTRLVLDPFMGSGTTVVVSQRLNLACIGFEVDEEYVRQSGVRLRDGAVVKRKTGSGRRFPAIDGVSEGQTASGETSAAPGGHSTLNCAIDHGSTEPESREDRSGLRDGLAKLEDELGSGANDG